MDPIAGIIALADHVAPAALVYARIGGIFVAAPILSGPMVPMQIKALLTLAITIAVLPALGPEMATGVPGPLYPLVLLQELGIGLAIGFCFSLFLEAVRFAGDLLGRTAGFAAAEYFNPDAGTMEGPLGSLFYTTMVLVFFAIDGHLEIIAALARSYAMVPPGAGELGPHFAEAVSTGISRVYEIALTIALPIEGAILAIVIAEGVVARAVPQINILQMTFAIKILTTMSLIIVGIPAIIAFMGLILGMAHYFTFSFLVALGGG